MNKDYEQQAGTPDLSAEPDKVEQAHAHPDAAETTSHLGMGLIGEQLRKSYKELLDEPVPDKFLKILSEMESKETDKDKE